MEQFVIQVLGTLLKLAYILPFANFYILAKREREFIYNNSLIKIKIGLILGLITVSLLLMINTLAFLGVINQNNQDLDFMFIYQIVINSLLIIAYSLLISGMYELGKKQFTNTELTNIIAYILLISTLTIITETNILYIINIITYFIAIYLLINSLALTGFLIKKYQSKGYLMALIGSFAILVDPLMYVKMYHAILLNYPDFTGFYYYRQLMYTVGSLAITLVLIPNIRFLTKLLRKEVITYSPTDTNVERLIKRLSIEMQHILGVVVITIFDLACKDYQGIHAKSIKYNKNLDIKNLDESEQKELLKILILRYNRIISAPVTEMILKKIKDKNNENLITEIISNK